MQCLNAQIIHRQTSYLSVLVGTYAWILKYEIIDLKIVKIVYTLKNLIKGCLCGVKTNVYLVQF